MFVVPLSSKCPRAYSHYCLAWARATLERPGAGTSISCKEWHQDILKTTPAHTHPPTLLSLPSFLLVLGFFHFLLTSLPSDPRNKIRVHQRLCSDPLFFLLRLFLLKLCSLYQFCLPDFPVSLPWEVSGSLCARTVAGQLYKNCCRPTLQLAWTS